MFMDNVFDFESDLVQQTREFVDNNPQVSVFEDDFVNSAFLFIALNDLLTEDCIFYMILLGIRSQ